MITISKPLKQNKNKRMDDRRYNLNFKDVSPLYFCCGGGLLYSAELSVVDISRVDVVESLLGLTNIFGDQASGATFRNFNSFSHGGTACKIC